MAVRDPGIIVATTVPFELVPDVDEMEATLREVGAFMDNPIALLERAIELLKQKRNEIATYILFGALSMHLLNRGISAAADAIF